MIETKTLHILKNIKIIFKVACIDDKFNKPIALYRGKNAVNKFIEAFLEEYDYFKKVIKVMSVEDERRF